MVRQPGVAQLLGDAGTVFALDLDQRADFFVEQGTDDVFEVAAGHQVGALFGAIDIERLGVEADTVEVQGHAAAAGKGHFGGSGKQAAVGTVVISLDQAGAVEVLDGVEQRLELLRFVHIRGVAAGGVIHLRQAGAAEALFFRGRSGSNRCRRSRG